MPVAPQPRNKVIRALTKAYRCHYDREGRKHTICTRDDIPEPIAVPRHPMISPGVLRNISDILGVSLREFLETLRQC